MKQNAQGLWVPDDYREPEQAQRRFPPSFVVPDDTKHPGANVTTFGTGMYEPCRDWMYPGRGTRGIEHQT